MLKMEKDYIEEYGDIPKEFLERYLTLLNETNLHRCKLKVYDEIDRISKIKWKTLSFTIYLIPKATPRPRCSTRGVFYVRGASDNKKFMKDYIKNMKNLEDIPLITTPIKFYCTSYFPIPKAMNPVEKILAELGYIYPISKPDWDNVGKTYCDMIQDLLIYDDSLVIEGVSKKMYSTKPRIEITLQYMEDFDSNFNRSKILKKGGQ